MLLGASGVAAVGVAGTFVGMRASLAEAGLPASKRFNLAADAMRTAVFEKSLWNVTVMQSFAFDDVRQRIYTAQVMQPGVQLAEPRTYTGTERAAKGDMCISELDMAGNRLGQMYLLGFGHGVSIGVEPGDGGPYLWTETDGANYGGKDTWGTKIARFPFVNGAVLTKASPIDKYDPVPGATHLTVAVDNQHGLIGVKHKVGETIKYSVYQLDQFKARQFTPLVTVDQPGVVAPNGVPFQGWAVYGQYLYMLDGSAYGTYGSTPPDGNTYLTSYDLAANKVVQRSITRAASGLEHREPEGMAVRRNQPGDANSAVLCFGLASGATGARKATIYEKRVLV